MSEKHYVIYDSAYLVSEDGSINGKPLKDGEDCASVVGAAKQTFCQQFFETNTFRHVVVLSGAGTSMGIALKKGGMGRVELWRECQEAINAICEQLPNRSQSCLTAEAKCDIEGFLSYVERCVSVMPQQKALSESVEKLKKKIRENCQLEFGGGYDPHMTFLKKLIARKSSLPRVEIFTTNYDTLFEQAAREANIVVVDGFSFSHPRVFSGRYFDLDMVNRGRARIKNEENFIPNVIHLLKLHGSVDWICDNAGRVLQSGSIKNDDALMIYPSSDKYAASYDQPFFEMMSRFQSAVRREDTLLIVVGFGFLDKHINNVIIEAVKQNPSFHLLIVDYNPGTTHVDLEKYESLFGGMPQNVSLLNGTFDDFAKCMPMNKSYQFLLGGGEDNALRM